MCSGGALVGGIGLGLQGAGILANVVGQKQAASANANYRALQTKATLANYIQQTQAVNNRQQEEEQASSLDLQQKQIANMQARATAITSAASNGIDSQTIQNLFFGYDRANAINSYVAAKNLQFKRLQNIDNIKALRANAISSINLQQPYVDTTGSTLMSGLGSMMKSYADFDWKQQYLKKLGG